MKNRRIAEDDTAFVAATEDDIASRLEATGLNLSKKTQVKAEQAQFAPNPYEFTE